MDENGNIILDQLIQSHNPNQEANELTLYQHILQQANLNKQDTGLDLDTIQDYE